MVRPLPLQKEVYRVGEPQRFPYYCGYEAEQFAFYRIPKLLVTDERF